MNLTFRSAVPGDIPLLRDLATRIWRLSYVEMISAEQIDYMLEWMYAAETIAQEMAAGVIWELALLDEEPIGYLALACPGNDHCELTKLYLLPEHQGHGLGQKMLAHAMELAHRHGCTEVRLRVNKQNTRALRAYERAGFAIVAEDVADIGGGYVMDDYLLARAVGGTA